VAPLSATHQVVSEAVITRTPVSCMSLHIQVTNLEGDPLLQITPGTCQTWPRKTLHMRTDQNRKKPSFSRGEIYKASLPIRSVLLRVSRAGETVDKLRNFLIIDRCLNYISQRFLNCGTTVYKKLCSLFFKHLLLS